jgi:hypothetical protein
MTKSFSSFFELLRYDCLPLAAIKFFNLLPNFSSTIDIKIQFFSYLNPLHQISTKIPLRSLTIMLRKKKKTKEGEVKEKQNIKKCIYEFFFFKKKKIC